MRNSKLSIELLITCEPEVSGRSEASKMQDSGPIVINLEKGDSGGQ